MTDRPVPRYPDTELDVEWVIGSSGSGATANRAVSTTWPPRSASRVVRAPTESTSQGWSRPADHCGTGGRQVPLDANGVHHLQSRAGGRIGDQRRGVLCVGSFWHPPGSATPSPAPHHRSRRRRPSRQPVSRPEPVVVSMASRTERNPTPAPPTRSRVARGRKRPSRSSRHATKVSPGRKLCSHLIQLRPAIEVPRRVVDIDPPAAGRCELVGLWIGVLFRCGNPGVARR
jgi:hypothetical protein